MTSKEEEEEQIALAIEASIRDMNQSSSIRLDSSKANRHPDDPNLIEIKSLNQFHASFRDAIERYESPSAICGMMATANAVLLAQALFKIKDEVSSLNQVMELNKRILQDEKLVKKKTESVMKFVRDSRRKDIEAHKDIKSKDKYMRAWTSNYEISDYLQNEEGITPNIFFLRHNQWPERGIATFEEKKRLVEEKSFGDKIDDKKWEKNATPYIMESFLPKRALFKPTPITRSNNNVYILDTNGHFVIAVPLVSRRQVVVINTTESHYIKSEVVVYLKSLLL